MNQESGEPRKREKSKDKGLEAVNRWLSSEWGREKKRGKGEMRQEGRRGISNQQLEYIKDNS